MPAIGTPMVSHGAQHLANPLNVWHKPVRWAATLDPKAREAHWLEHVRNHNTSLHRISF